MNARAAGVALAALSLASIGCGSKGSYSFDQPAGFKPLDPKEFNTVLGKVPGENQKLLRQSGGSAFNFIRTYTTHDQKDIGSIGPVIDQLIPLFASRLHTKLLGRVETTIDGVQAIRLELQPADVLGRPLESWLTVAAKGKTAYFVQCQWERKPAARAAVTAACQHVLQTFKLP